MNDWMDKDLEDDTNNVIEATAFIFNDSYIDAIIEDKNNIVYNPTDFKEASELAEELINIGVLHDLKITRVALMSVMASLEIMIKKVTK